MNAQLPHVSPVPPQPSKAAQELQHRILEELEVIGRRQDRQEKDIAELKVGGCRVYKFVNTKSPVQAKMSGVETQRVQKEQENFYRHKQLEERLEELSELHHSSIDALRSDMQTIANRMEYSHMDSLRELKEVLEQSTNRVRYGVLN
jgi:hypothetical protein